MPSCSKTSWSSACSADVRAPVSIFARISVIPRSGRAISSRQPTTSGAFLGLDRVPFMLLSLVTRYSTHCRFFANRTAPTPFEAVWCQSRQRCPTLQLIIVIIIRPFEGRRRNLGGGCGRAARPFLADCCRVTHYHRHWLGLGPFGLVAGIGRCARTAYEAFPAGWQSQTEILAVGTRTAIRLTGNTE